MPSEAIFRYDRDLDLVRGFHQPKARLLSACYEPTNVCRGGCPYCLIEYKQGEPDLESSLTSLRILIQRGILRIGFGGGEPLECSYIYKLGEYLRTAGVGSLLRTSGMYKINTSLCKSAFDWVDLSLDSIDPSIMKKARPGIKLNTILSNIHSLVTDGIKTRVSILVSQINQGSLESTIRWLAASGVVSIRFQRVVPRGRARLAWNELAISSDHYRRCLDSVLSLCDNLGVKGKALPSIERETLLIIKPGGDMFTGNPEGIRFLGQIKDDSCWATAQRRIGEAQANNYFQLL